MDYLGALAAVTLGAILGFLGSYLVSRLERVAAGKEEVRRLLGSYQADVAVAVARMREIPNVGEPNALSKVVDEIRGPVATWADTQKQLLRILGPDWRAPIERVIRTGAQLKLFGISTGLENAIQDVEDYLIRLGESRQQTVLDEWPSIHSVLDRECHNELKRRTRLMG
jgi:hypothetical protein